MHLLGNLLGEGEEPEAEDDLVFDLEVGLLLALLQDIQKPLHTLRGFIELDANVRDEEEVHEGLDGGLKLDGGGAPQLGDQPVKVLLEILVGDGSSRAGSGRR